MCWRPFVALYKCNSPDEEEEVAGEGSRLTRACVVESTDRDCGEAWAIVKRAGVCISHTSSGTGGGSTKGVRQEGRMLSTSSIVRSHAVGSTFGGLDDPTSCVNEVTAVVLLEQINC